MKQFNLEEYLKNPSRKVVTRDDRPVRIICTDRKGATPIIALINDGLSEELGHAFYSNGKIFSDEDNELDLFFAPEKHEGWFNIYHSDESGFYVRQYHPYKSKDEADEIAKANHRAFFATSKVEWEE